ncbi:hypothetical protein IMG5_167630 [Ichthyophthirius multifiliis]|uniref:Uncharacterized protein n=1 Tax=Ichthyophthirius multifiliis TaxID=5932 RepID=G0R0Y9_ICHMU|nr:hypothetical protein IMG5_167630 [Ichthyophthirius multifiliis]EGR28854.1 hypothetical protein IMG5_167630 [Ichthyophthirius multifiliis]|eukprot:XP_004030090.1 hypothetical protein IMG5_167630 [Ichthyophthirius multifiliis]
MLVGLDYQQYYEEARYVVAGLYILSSLILLSNCKIVPFLVTLGIIANTVLQTLPTLLENNQDQNALATVLKNVSIIAGLFYLMGSSSSSCRNKKVKQD